MQINNLSHKFVPKRTYTFLSVKRWSTTRDLLTDLVLGGGGCMIPIHDHVHVSYIRLVLLFFLDGRKTPYLCRCDKMF